MTNNTQKGFFVTGTDTEIGKTFVTGSIGHTLHQHGIKATPRKPIASGCVKQADGSLASEDALFLQSSFHTQDTLEDICPVLFEQAVSPKLAMELNNHFLNISDLAVNCRLQNADGITFVEGAGGFYSPLAMDGLNADLAEELGYPVILVVGDRLGCINHALLTLEAISNRGLKTVAIVINRLHPSQTFSQGIRDLVDVPVFYCPHSESGTPAHLEDKLLDALLKD